MIICFLVSLREQFRLLYVVDNSLLALHIRLFICKSDAIKEIILKDIFPPAVSCGL